MALFDHPRAALTPAGYKAVAPADVPTSDDFQVIDVRSPAEFTAPPGHLPRAKNVPLATLAAAAATWDRDAEYLVVCQTGGRSARAVQALLQLGFKRPVNLSGGTTAWAAAGLPTER